MSQEEGQMPQVKFRMVSQGRLWGGRDGYGLSQ